MTRISITVKSRHGSHQFEAEIHEHQSLADFHLDPETFTASGEAKCRNCLIMKSRSRHPAVISSRRGCCTCIDLAKAKPCSFASLTASPRPKRRVEFSGPGVWVRWRRSSRMLISTPFTRSVAIVWRWSSVSAMGL